MTLKNNRSLFLPALVIVATVLILLFVIAYSTYLNVDRESARMEETLVREARGIVNVINAAVKEDYSLRLPARRINKLLEDISQNPDIAGIAVIDSQGRLVAYSPSGEGRRGVQDGASLYMLAGRKGIVARHGRDLSGERTLEIVQPLRPLSPSGATMRRKGRTASGENDRRPYDKIVSVSFRLQAFDRAKRDDFRHVILMGAILIILGTGSVYFIFIVQKYYRDLREMHELKERVLRSEHLASLGRLAAGIAHEIRNPLSSIRGFAQFFLNRFQGKKEEQEYAAVMVKEVDRLNGVISELLDFANPRQLRREPCSLTAVVDYALKVLALELERKKVLVKKHFSGGLPPVSLDQERMSQAFLNLFLNSLDAVAEGGRIMINIQKDPGRDAVNIVLTDDGRGVPPGDMEKIFEPFFSTKRKGVGMGLAVVRQIVESHGGEIWAENGPEGGTKFCIILPVSGGYPGFPK